MVDAYGPGPVLSLEEVQATGPVEEASTVVNSDSRNSDPPRCFRAEEEDYQKLRSSTTFRRQIGVSSWCSDPAIDPQRPGVTPQVMPEVLHRVQLGRGRHQLDRAHVGRYHQV